MHLLYKANYLRYYVLFSDKFNFFCLKQALKMANVAKNNNFV